MFKRRRAFPVEATRIEGALMEESLGGIVAAHRGYQIAGGYY